MNADDVLAHHGVKGMKWGQRRARTDRGSIQVSKPGAPNDVIVTQRGKAGLTTKGGKRAEASLDAQRAAAGKKYIKSSGIHTLSNKELQDVVTRMNLEQQYMKLANPNKQKKGDDLLSTLMKEAPKILLAK